MQSSTSPYVHTWPCCSCMHVCVPSPKEWSWAPRHQVQERNISGLMRHQHCIRVEKGAGLSLRTVCCIALQLQVVRACDQIHASCSLPMIQGPRCQVARRIYMPVACSCRVTAWIRLPGIQAGLNALSICPKVGRILALYGRWPLETKPASDMHPAAGNDQPMPHGCECDLFQ